MNILQNWGTVFLMKTRYFLLCTGSLRCTKHLCHRFIVASKLCCTKKVSKAVSRAFKLVFGQVESFHQKAKFDSPYSKFWVLQNVDPVIEKLKNINKRKNAKSISTYDFSTSYTKIPHEDLINRMTKLIKFTFNGGDAKYINISERGY